MKFNPKSGQSLMEVLISIAIVAVIASAAVGAILTSATSSTKNRATELATSYEQEEMNNIKSVAESDWYELYDLTKSTSSTYYLATYTQLAGTVSVTTSSPTIAGSGTTFTGNVTSSDNITIGTIPYTINSVVSTSSLTVNSPYPTSTASGLSIYRNFSIRSGVETLTENNITFSRWFTVANVLRNTCGTGTVATSSTQTSCSVSTSTGAISGVLNDPSTQEVTVNITWGTGQAVGSYSVTQYISRTRDETTLQNNWSGGVVSSSTIFTQSPTQYNSESGLNLSTQGVLMLP